MEIPVATPTGSPTMSRVHRRLRVDEYSRAQTGVWYYQVDIELRHTRQRLDEWEDDAIHFYSVRRRYTDFLHLYEQIKQQLEERPQNMATDTCIPLFPQKEYISSSVLGLIWRTSSPSYVLEERRAKFAALLIWIEENPVLHDCAAFIEFLGDPPQCHQGYVSLKEYSSQHWLSSLQQLTRDKQKRRHRLASDCSSSSSLVQEQLRSSKRRRQVDCSLIGENGEHTKRQQRPTKPSMPTSQVAITSRRKRQQRPPSRSSLSEVRKGVCCQPPLLSEKNRTVAQVESTDTVPY